MLNWMFLQKSAYRTLIIIQFDNSHTSIVCTYIYCMQPAVFCVCSSVSPLVSTGSSEKYHIYLKNYENKWKHGS
jgi:hypothetical protein